jgi:hypothetical protein
LDDGSTPAWMALERLPLMYVPSAASARRKAFLRHTDHLGLFFRSDVVQGKLAPPKGAVFKLF